MKLPNKELAKIERKKITHYLLNLYHPDGWPKAKFFREIGFNESNIDEFEEALLKIGKTNDVVKVDKSKSKYAIKYTIDGTIVSPKNTKRYNIRTGWKINKGQKTPKLVAAFPNV